MMNPNEQNPQTPQNNPAQPPTPAPQPPQPAQPHIFKYTIQNGLADLRRGISRSGANFWKWVVVSAVVQFIITALLYLGFAAVFVSLFGFTISGENLLRFIGLLILVFFMTPILASVLVSVYTYGPARSIVNGLRSANAKSTLTRPSFFKIFITYFILLTITAVPFTFFSAFGAFGVILMAAWAIFIVLRFITAPFLLLLDHNLGPISAMKRSAVVSKLPGSTPYLGILMAIVVGISVLTGTIANASDFIESALSMQTILEGGVHAAVYAIVSIGSAVLTSLYFGAIALLGEAHSNNTATT